MGWGLLNAAQTYSPAPGVHYLSRTPRLFESFGILTVFYLYKLHLGVFMYNHQRHFLPLIFDDYFDTNASVHDHFTRSQSGFHVVSYKTNIRGFTVRIAGPKLWNSINTDVRGKLSLNAFKIAYKKLLLSHYH